MLAFWNSLFSPHSRLVVDRIVSLGGMCEAAFQGRRLSGSGRAYPFDWWITPLESVPIVLDGGAAPCFAAEHILKVEDYGGEPALYSRRSRTVHLHEFPKTENFLALDVEAIAARLQAKYAALDARLAADCAEGTTLFLRQRLKDHDPTGEELEALLDSIIVRLTEIAANARLLLLDYDPVRPRDKLIQAEASRLKDANDLGSDKGWNALFRTCRIASRSAKRFSWTDLQESFRTRG